MVATDTINKLVPGDLGEGMASKCPPMGMPPQLPNMLKPPQKTQG